MNYSRERASLDARRNSELHRLRALGLTYAEIASTVGVPYGTAYSILNPQYRRRQSERERQQRPRLRPVA